MRDILLRAVFAALYALVFIAYSSDAGPFDGNSLNNVAWWFGATSLVIVTASILINERKVSGVR
ncbi:MAG: hypothetical protein ACJ77F_09925 [Chloroflexota bacterium]